MELGINVLSGKWRLLILWRIHAGGAVRYNELQKQVGKITAKTLTAQLRELERLNIINRTVYPENPPKVEYSLSEIGKNLVPVLESLCDFGKMYQKNMTPLDKQTADA